MQVTFGTLMAIGFLASPIMLAWGWIRFAKLPRLGTVGSVLSLIGLILATASAALAVSSIGYAVVIRGFPYYDPRLMRIFRWGIFLSLCGIVGNRGHWKTDFTALARPTFRSVRAGILDSGGGG
jgi:hypothetical protein